MAYEKQVWKDGEEGGTPISASRLNHIEEGIAAKAEQGPKGEPGKDGVDGSTGPAGKDGANGSDGKDGRGISNITIEGNTLIFTMTEGEDIKVDLPSEEGAEE